MAASEKLSKQMYGNETGALRAKLWDENFKKLEKYLRRHGTWRVKKSKDLRLSEWLKRQKRNYKNLSADRRRKLANLGVQGTYQVADQAWNSKYEQLRLFKKTNGHIVVGKSNKSLFEWIHNQKWMKSHGKLTVEREKKLMQIGFVWSGELERRRQAHWEMMFKTFSEFQRKHGKRYVLLLKDYKDINSWVDRQKRNKRKMSKARINRLNEIQFPWRTRDLQVQARSETN